MRNKIFLYLCTVLIAFASCNKTETASEVLQKTINTIDTIETIYYKQIMSRTNPQNVSDTMTRYREMYFTRLKKDSIVGVKGHWYMYIDDQENVIYEDIYDGNQLIRKNNRDSTALLYDLIKYPEFKEKHFWGHNTPFGMQYELRYILAHTDSYVIKRLNDTVIDNKNCFQIAVYLENKTTMPGFATNLEADVGNMSKTTYFIDKTKCYPIRMLGESYPIENPNEKVFIDQKYYDIAFNIKIDEQIQFNTSIESLAGYRINQIQP